MKIEKITNGIHSTENHLVQIDTNTSSLWITTKGGSVGIWHKKLILCGKYSMWPFDLTRYGYKFKPKNKEGGNEQ